MDIDFSNIETPSYRQIESKNSKGLPYVFYGPNNLFPNEEIFFSEKSVTHSACLRLIEKSVVGEGFEVTNNDEAVLSFLKQLDFQTESSTLLEKMAKYMTVLNGLCFEIIWNKKGDKINKPLLIPFENVRASFPDKYRRVAGYYYNPDWACSSFLTDDTDYFPRFDPLTAKKDGSQVLYMYKSSLLSPCYPVPEYNSAIDYIAAEYQIAIHSFSSASNSFANGNLITAPDSAYPTKEDKISFKDKFDRNYMGPDKSGANIFNFPSSPDKKIIIEPISSNYGIDKFLSISQMSQQKILTANGILASSLVGIPDGSALFSNPEELSKIFDMFYGVTIRDYQKKIEETMNIILEFSGFPNAGYKIKPLNLNMTTNTPSIITQ